MADRCATPEEIVTKLGQVEVLVGLDLLPGNWTDLRWNFPPMIPCAGAGGY